jgi:hypothetical protein
MVAGTATPQRGPILTVRGPCGNGSICDPERQRQKWDQVLGVQVAR